MLKKQKSGPTKKVKMLDYDQIIEKNTYPRSVFDQHSGKTVQVKDTVETVKRYNKNVTYKLPVAIADKLLGKKTAVLA
jgi:hypothetical protein